MIDLYSGSFSKVKMSKMNLAPDGYDYGRCLEAFKSCIEMNMAETLNSTATN